MPDKYEEIIQIFNEATLQEKEEVLRNALSQDPLIAFTIFNAASLEGMYQLITNLPPFQVVSFFDLCWNHLGDEDNERIDYIAILIIRLWQNFPDSTYATHLLIWMFLSEYSLGVDLVNRFVSTLKSVNYPIPDNLLLQEK
jgi:hypothetical protein